MSLQENSIEISIENWHIEIHRVSMELHMPIFFGEILWRFQWIFPLEMALNYKLVSDQ
jgi:hypothetical protein